MICSICKSIINDIDEIILEVKLEKYFHKSCFEPSFHEKDWTHYKIGLYRDLK